MFCKINFIYQIFFYQSLPYCNQSSGSTGQQLVLTEQRLSLMFVGPLKISLQYYKFAIARWIEGTSFCRCKIAHIEIPWGNQSQKLVLCMHYHTKDMERRQSCKILILTTQSRKSDVDHCIDTLSEINFTSYLSTISEQSGIVQHLLNVKWLCT